MSKTLTCDSNFFFGQRPTVFFLRPPVFFLLLHFDRVFCSMMEIKSKKKKKGNLSQFTPMQLGFRQCAKSLTTKKNMCDSQPKNMANSKCKY